MPFGILSITNKNINKPHANEADFVIKKRSLSSQLVDACLGFTQPAAPHNVQRLAVNSIKDGDPVLGPATNLKITFSSGAISEAVNGMGVGARKCQSPREMFLREMTTE